MKSNIIKIFLLSFAVAAFAAAFCVGTAAWTYSGFGGDYNVTISVGEEFRISTGEFPENGCFCAYDAFCPVLDPDAPIALLSTLEDDAGFPIYIFSFSSSGTFSNALFFEGGDAAFSFTVLDSYASSGTVSDDKYDELLNKYNSLYQSYVGQDMVLIEVDFLYLLALGNRSAGDFCYYADFENYIRKDNGDPYSIRLRTDSGVLTYDENNPDYYFINGQELERGMIESGQIIKVYIDKNSIIDMSYEYFLSLLGAVESADKYSSDYKVGYDEGYSRAEAIKDHFYSTVISLYENQNSEIYQEKFDFGYESGYQACLKADKNYETIFQAGYTQARNDYIDVSDGNAVSGLFMGLFSGIIQGYKTISDGVSIGGITLGKVISTLLVVFLVYSVVKFVLFRS